MHNVVNLAYSRLAYLGHNSAGCDSTGYTCGSGLAIAALADALSNANVNVPVLGLELWGTAQEVSTGAREQVIVEPQRQAAIGMALQTIPADLSAR